MKQTKTHFVHEAILTQVVAAAFLAAGCNLPAEEEPEQSTEATRNAAVKILNGTQLPAGQLNDSAVFLARSDDGRTCSATLLTNNWVLTAWHCRSPDPYGTVRVFYNQSCNPQNGDADCASRAARCLYNYWGTYNCGAEVAETYNNPLQWDGNQVELMRLSTPIRAVSVGGRWTIAQPVYFGSKDNLKNKSVTVLGTACGTSPPSPWGTMLQGAFRIRGGTFPKYAYYIDVVNNQGIVKGDSGGAGYWNMSGSNVLVGTTVTGQKDCATLGEGSQHDLTEVQGWFDNTLFSPPAVLQANVGGYAMGMNATGAIAVFNSGNYLYLTTCASEPCDQRGSWTAPQVVQTTSNASAPAIAIDNPGAQMIFNAPYPAGNGALYAAGVAGNTSLVTYIGATCTSTPGASSRPGTSPPLIDVGCVGSDGNVWVSYRLNGVWRSAPYSLGKPASLISTSPPAIVSTTGGTTYVFVVATDGSVRYRIGAAGSWGSWTSLYGGGVTRVAATSYAASRIDVFAVGPGGVMYHKFLDAGAGWSPNWLPLTAGSWSGSVAPFAAAYSGHKARMNVGSVDAWNNAQVQRYSDW